MVTDEGLIFQAYVAAGEFGPYEAPEPVPLPRRHHHLCSTRGEPDDKFKCDCKGLYARDYDELT